jgi:catechol 2,3-dioxygenase-like lactoylglutathione lyase family enzyme
MPIPTLSIAHVNLNCRDLARNRGFFEALGLSPTIRTDPAPQDCRAFGFEGEARWDAWMMQDARAGGTSLDLLEWKEPAPVGVPPIPGTRPGFERLGLTTSDVEAARDIVLAGGGTASEIHELPLAPGMTRIGFGATTPEGQALLVLAADADRLAHVGIGCSDLERSEAFYERVFGTNRAAAITPESLPGSVFQPGHENASTSIRWEARMLFPPNPAPEPGQPHPFHILLTQWQPGPKGRGLAEPNHAGLFRMAFLVEDIDSCHAQLIELGVADLSPVVSLDLGPSCPAPSCRALFFRDPDGTCLELIGAPLQ